MSSSRVVIVHGQTLFRQGLTAVLREHGFDVVGDAANAEEGRLACERTAPDLILIGSRIAEVTMCATAPVLPCLRARCSRAAILIIGETDDGASETGTAQAKRERWVREGASAYLSSSLDQEELVRVLRMAAETSRETAEGDAGKRWHDSGRGESGRCPRSSAVPADGGTVTERETSILQLIADGLSNKEIAQRLAISTQTVKNHVHHLLEKLSLSDRTQLAVFAVEKGIRKHGV